MYVIYINDRPLYLSAQDRPEVTNAHPDNGHLRAVYSGKRKTLLNYVDTLEKSSRRIRSVELTHADPEALWEDLKSHFKWVPAAGGLVTHTDLDRELFIFRRDHWDLPKGKIDDGEDAPSAALREVQEETGLEHVQLGEALPTTYHTYRTGKGKRILKPTYWFRMRTTQTELTPETGEDIERAEWRKLEEVLAAPRPLYNSLRHMLERVDA